MNKARKLLFSVCVLLMANMIVGCEAGNNAKEEENEMDITQGFTDRQKEILEMKGWPTDLSQLDGDQMMEIDVIEECLQYIENKYPDDKFEYLEYLGLASDNSYGVRVKSEKLKDIEPVVVYACYSNKERKEYFEDNYEVVIAMGKLRNDIMKNLEDKKPGVKIKTYMDARVIRDGKTMETDDNWHQPVVLFTTNVFTGPEDVEQTMREIAENLLKQYDEEMVWFEVIVLSDADLENAEPTYNYGNDYVRGNKSKPIYVFDCIYEDGVIDVERWK